MVLSVSMLNKLAIMTNEKTIFNRAELEIKSALLMVYLERKEDRINHLRQFVLDGMTSPLTATSPVHTALRKPDEFEGMKVKDFYGFFNQYAMWNRT